MADQKQFPHGGPAPRARRQLTPGGTTPRTPRQLTPGGTTPRAPRQLTPGGTTPRAPRHPANGAWEALLAAHASLIRRFAAEDIWGDVSMKEYDVLYALSKCPAPIRLSELNRHVLLSQPALSRLADRLVERGLVSRAADPADGRGIRLALTATGLAVQRRIGQRHARSVAQAVRARLTPAEVRQLEEICAKLAETSPRSE